MEQNSYASPKMGNNNKNNKRRGNSNQKRAGGGPASIGKQQQQQHYNNNNINNNNRNYGQSPKTNNYQIQRNQNVFHQKRYNQHQQNQHMQQHHQHSRGNNYRKHRSISPNQYLQHECTGPRPPPDIAVIVNRVDLHDSASNIQPLENQKQPDSYDFNNYPIAPYYFAPDMAHWMSLQKKLEQLQISTNNGDSIEGEKQQQQQDEQQRNQVLASSSSSGNALFVVRVPYTVKFGPNTSHDHHDPVVDKTPNPFDPSIDKYWAQRRRLFSMFDYGIQLDKESWYSVTPEIIADHVAHRVADMASQYISRAMAQQQQQQQQSAMQQQQHHPHAGFCPPPGPPPQTRGFILLDAFCGCGGNSIAFGKIPSHLVSMIVCVDTDRKKLRMAARNASIYNIPNNKLVFVECNSTFILKHCYKNGQFILDQPSQTSAADPPMQMPKPVPTEVYAGYQIGGINMLPRYIDIVFMDPPWGGVDYEVLGKNGYDLCKNMKIPSTTKMSTSKSNPQQQQQQQEKEEEKGPASNGELCDDFFDSFLSKPMSIKEKKASFNNTAYLTTGGCSDRGSTDPDDYVNGTDLLVMAAAATGTRFVLYDLPRNTSKESLGKSALKAGYHGNCKLEEHYLNGRLKTVTAYFGAEYSALLRPRN